MGGHSRLILENNEIRQARLRTAHRALDIVALTELDWCNSGGVSTGMTASRVLGHIDLTTTLGVV